MNHQFTREGRKAVLTFAGDLTVEHAEEIRTAFIEALAKTKVLSMVFTDVTAADLSFLELLCSAHRTALRLNKRLEFAGARPAAVIRAMAAAGFERQSGCKLDTGNSCLWVGREGKEQPAS